MKLSDELLSLLFADALPLTVVRGTIKRIKVKFSWDCLLKSHDQLEEQRRNAPPGDSKENSPFFEIEVHGAHLEVKFVPPSQWEERAARVVAYAQKSKKRLLSGYFQKEPSQITQIVLRMKRWMRMSLHEVSLVFLHNEPDTFLSPGRVFLALRIPYVGFADPDETFVNADGRLMRFDEDADNGKGAFYCGQTERSGRALKGVIAGLESGEHVGGKSPHGDHERDEGASFLSFLFVCCLIRTSKK